MTAFLRALAAGWAAIAAVVPLPGAAGDDMIFRDGFNGPPDCYMLGTPSCPGFEIDMPPVEIAPAQSGAYCYYFRSPNAAVLGVGRFSSTFGDAVQHIIVHTTFNAGGMPADRRPPGTLSPVDCGWEYNTNNVSARRIYAAHDPVEQLDMPGDDGTGTPLAIELLADQPMFIEMYLVNATASPLTASATLRAHGLASGSSYTKTATYMTYNPSLTLPPLSPSTASMDCAVPADVRFWWFSTHTHRYATSATLLNGATNLVMTTDWQQPAITRFDPPAFYQFGAAERLAYECAYFNASGGTVHSGGNYETDENCVGIGYFFPADRPLLCIGEIGPL